MDRLSAAVRLAAALLALLAAARAHAQPSVVDVSASPAHAQVVPGEQVPIAVVFHHKPGWHINTSAPIVPPEMEGLEPIPTTLTATSPEAVRFWPVQWPPVHQVEVAFTGAPVQYGVYEGRAIAFVPVQIAASAAVGSTLTINLAAAFQACDDSVCLPREDLELTVQLAVIDPAQASTRPAEGPDFASFDKSVFSRPPLPAVTPGNPGPAASVDPGPVRDFGAFGLSLRFDTSGALGTVLVMLVAVLGGLVLNLTPCVLPVIPIKIMGLAQAAGNPRRCLFLGFMTSLGVICFWSAIGVLIAGLKTIDAVSQLFGNPWFGLGVGAFIAAMSFGMLGAFTLQLPQAVYQYTPRHETGAGSFMFGVMTAILGTPCFGPFAGGAAAWATAQPLATAIGAFTCIGAGMALPYLILSARPSWVNRIPRTGPASELIKQVMGLLLLAAAAYFIGAAILSLVAELPYLRGVIYWWFAAFFTVAGGVWLAFRTVQITRSPARRAIFILAGLVIAFVGAWWAWYQTSVAAAAYVPGDSTGHTEGVWRSYNHSAFQSAIADKKTVVIDFTADWCLNCKVIEAAVLNRAEVQAALAQPGVIAFKADLTSRKAEGWKALSDLGERGIPLLAVFGPGTPAPFKSNAYTPAQVLDAISRARGG